MADLELEPLCQLRFNDEVLGVRFVVVPDDDLRRKFYVDFEIESLICDRLQSVQEIIRFTRIMGYQELYEQGDKLATSNEHYITVRDLSHYPQMVRMAIDSILEHLYDKTMRKEHEEKYGMTREDVEKLARNFHKNQSTKKWY